MRAVFLDRDGTIGGTGGGVHPDDFTMYDFAPKAIKTLNDMGIKVFLFTNQTRIGRGYFTEDDLHKGFRTMKEELLCHSAFLDDIFYCPHKPDDGCYVVGDNGGSDMLAAYKVGAKKILVKTGWGESSLGVYRSQWKEVEPDYIAVDLLDVVNWISTFVGKES